MSTLIALGFGVEESAHGQERTDWLPIPLPERIVTTREAGGEHLSGNPVTHLSIPRSKYGAGGGMQMPLSARGPTFLRSSQPYEPIDERRSALSAGDWRPSLRGSVRMQSGDGYEISRRSPDRSHYGAIGSLTVVFLLDVHGV